MRKEIWGITGGGEAALLARLTLKVENVVLNKIRYLVVHKVNDVIDRGCPLGVASEQRIKSTAQECDRKTKLNRN